MIIEVSWVNSLRLSDTINCQTFLWTLFQLMTCDWCQVSPWINVDLLSVRPIRMYFSDILFLKNVVQNVVSKMLASLLRPQCVNTLRPRQDGRHFPDFIYKSISLNEKVLISIKISLKFFPRCPINNIQALVQIMAWRRPGDKPLSEPMMVSLPTQICVTRPQWVNQIKL